MNSFLPTLEEFVNCRIDELFNYDTSEIESRTASIAIQEIIKEYQRQKTNQRSRKGGSARKPQQYHAEAEVII